MHDRDSDCRIIVPFHNPRTYGYGYWILHHNYIPFHNKAVITLTHFYKENALSFKSFSHLMFISNHFVLILYVFVDNYNLPSNLLILISIYTNFNFALHKTFSNYIEIIINHSLFFYFARFCDISVFLAQIKTRKFLEHIIIFRETIFCKTSEYEENLTAATIYHFIILSYKIRFITSSQKT